METTNPNVHTLYWDGPVIIRYKHRCQVTSVGAKSHLPLLRLHSRKSHQGRKVPSVNRNPNGAAVSSSWCAIKKNAPKSVTVHLSAFLSVLRWPTLLYNTSLQHFSATLLANTSPTLFSNTYLSTMPLYNTSHQHFSTTLFSNTLLQHFSPTLLYNTSPQHFSPTLLHNTLLQHLSTTLLSNTSLQRFCTTLLPNIPLQDSSPTLLSNTLLQHFSATLLYKTKTEAHPKLNIKTQSNTTTKTQNHKKQHHTTKAAPHHHNTSLQPLSTTLLHDTLLQHFRCPSLQKVIVHPLLGPKNPAFLILILRIEIWFWPFFQKLWQHYTVHWLAWPWKALFSTKHMVWLQSTRLHSLDSVQKT